VKPVEICRGAPNSPTDLAVSRPKFTILSGRVEEVSIFNIFFRLSIRALAAEIQADKVVRWGQNGDFLHLIFSPSRVQHISNLHSKIALRSHHVWNYGRHTISDR